MVQTVLTKADLMAKLKVLEPVDKEQRNSMVCLLMGHSKIVTYCFGYVNCARCDAQIGDTLGSTHDMRSEVIVGHDCEMCRANFARLGWADKLYAPGPFKKDKVPS